jgi:hypothetical protein
MNAFTPVDTIDASNFLRAVGEPDGSVVEHFIMPATGLEYKGQPVTPAGFNSSHGASYSLFLTVDATIVAGAFTSLNATLWADPGSNDAPVTVSETSDPAFAHGMNNDIALATGTMVTASFNFDPATNIRTADFVESMTPTLAGSVLLHGSIQPGTELEEHLTTLPTAFSSNGITGPGMINWVHDGEAVVTVDPAGTILLPNIPPEILHLGRGPSFIHGADPA